MGSDKALCCSKPTIANGMMAPEIQLDHVIVPPNACARVFLATVLPTVLVCM